ncbi:zinc ribbon domain-containing protein [Psychrobacillus sp. OK032]|uniref:zinc ribbon domain-containing protein n=1 Tax=Psychrobacillus sp. OK032 TaxID=1884358 RepID=UPI0008D2EC13|nr:zinc ribbon domain-containing protein [Psychrobacillus sp. OK032]SES45195.1 3-hydroxy-3-methylglutaryl CoA synthase [Psychrobacillus sp. OK032]
MQGVGITSIGAYIPYYFMDRKTIGEAWGIKGMKGSKSIASVDEDSVTMSVEAALECLRYGNRNEIDGLYFASTTAPYSEKSHATLVSTVCDLNKDIFVADFNSSLRCATSALKAGYSEVLSGNSRAVLVTSADNRNAYPKSQQEQIFGDGAAAVTIGSKEVLATIDHVFSCQNEIHDIWRNQDDLYVRNAESRFAIDEGYNQSVEYAFHKILEKANLSVSDINKVILPTPGMKENIKLAKSLGLMDEQIQDTFVLSIGVLGAAQPLTMLVDAIEHAQVGDKLMLISYGNGADAFIFTVTEHINKVKGGNSVQKYLDNRSEFKEYGRFLSYRGVLEAVPGDDYKIPSSTAQTWREQEAYLKLYGSKCENCGTQVFPISRVCIHCGSKDEFVKVNKSEEITKLFTYSIDYLAGRSDDPVIVQSISEDANGTRFYLNMTDFNKEKIEIDMELEFTFRKMHNLGNFVNYYWKVRPIRRKRV